MTQNDDLLAWATLVRTPGLDIAQLSAALDLLGSAGALVAASEAGWHGAAIPPAARAFLSSPLAIPSNCERRWLESADHHLIPFTDPRFPALLLSIPECPLALYVSGSPAALAEPQLAIVGSRNPTAAGQRTAREFAHYLSGAGLTITSGLAIGIDAAAHEGALAGRGGTVAVLGCGLDVPYPPDNQPLLARLLAAGGAVLSEFPPGTPPRRAHFPQRNRLISGLSLGTLVVEAARQSGSLITARMAGQQGREVFAIPGSIHNPLARGCHALIRQGAKLVEEAADILSELQIPYTNQQLEEQPRPSESAGRLDNDYEILLDALGFEPASIDQLVERTGLASASVASMLLILELEGKVAPQAGGRYARP